MVETTGSSRNQETSLSLWEIFVGLFSVYVIFAIFGRASLLAWFISILGLMYYFKVNVFIENLLKKLREVNDDGDYDWDMCCLMNGCFLRRICACSHYESKHDKFVKAQKKNAKGTKSEEHHMRSAKGCPDASEFSPAKDPKEIEMKEILKKPNPIQEGTPIAWRTDMGDTESGSTHCMYMSAMGVKPGYWRCGFEGGQEAGIDLEKWCTKSRQVPNHIPTRVGYYRDSHRYPHWNVHPNDVLGQKHLQEAKDLWISKMDSGDVPITNLLDDVEPVTPKKIQE